MSRWDSLSIRERGTLFKEFLKLGIRDLGKIREYYNTFSGGGDTNSSEVLSSSDKEQIQHQVPVLQGMTDYFLSNYPPRNYVERPEYSLPFNKERLAILGGTSYVESYLSPYTNQGDTFAGAILPHNPKPNSLGLGLFQHSGSRKKKLLRYIEAHPQNSVLQNNLEFTDKEYHAQPGKGAEWQRRAGFRSGNQAKKDFESISSRAALKEGVELFNTHFISPAEATANLEKRTEAAEYIYDNILDSLMRKSWAKQILETFKFNYF